MTDKQYIIELEIYMITIARHMKKIRAMDIHEFVKLHIAHNNIQFALDGAWRARKKWLETLRALGSPGII
jgi:hypothetical protein